MGMIGGPPLGPNLKATASEARQFVASLRGKSAKEAMGIVAQSHLVRGMVLSTVIQVGILVVLTSLVFFFPDVFGRSKPAVAAAPSPTPAAVPTAPPLPTAAPASGPANAAATNVAAPGVAPDVAAKVMRTDAAKPEELEAKQPDDVDDLMNKLR